MYVIIIDSTMNTNAIDFSELKLPHPNLKNFQFYATFW